VDLRPYKGKTLSEYLKAVKYRDQEGNFKKANGEVIESKTFTIDECADVMRLWHQIAAKRISDGATPVLAIPDESFLKQLGECSSGNVTLMFLKVDGRTIASCVLFRLGDTITSDLQGLDYELARPLKAYFVMMQHVIAIALREGHSFVDFGPTTPKAKLDIGCQSVPLVGAMNALSRTISVAINIKAANMRKHGDKAS
jgi:CelD/BcsL family acetyltransferase involved in cellulose biosynthesis